jgi:hypothetical protein
LNTTLRAVLAVVAGAVGGSIVNMAIIMLGPKLVPHPPGVDVTDMESLKASMHLFEAKHYVSPFLAHALGTLAGGFLAASIAVTRKMTPALVVAMLFLAGGVMNAFALPAPAWFKVVDLAGAYLPMGWIGGRMAMRRR